MCHKIVIYRVFPLSQFKHILCFALSVCFYAQICQFGMVWYLECIFAVTMSFLLPSDYGVDEMSVSHAKEIWKYIL